MRALLRAPPANKRIAGECCCWCCMPSSVLSEVDSLLRCGGLAVHCVLVVGCWRPCRLCVLSMVQCYSIKVDLDPPLHPPYPGQLCAPCTACPCRECYRDTGFVLQGWWGHTCPVSKKAQTVLVLLYISFWCYLHIS
jgi:hypothetical protein